MHGHATQQDSSSNGLFKPVPAGIEFSFEIFPPKSAEMEKALWWTLRHLEPLTPLFVSVTCGAGGGAQDGTQKTLAEIQNQTGLTPAAHMTCISASRSEIDKIAEDYWARGIRHIVALRGDLPADGSASVPEAQRYGYASDLVAGLKRIADFEISVAAYPEKHPEASSMEADIDNLKRKIDAGADRAITQLFFDPDVYFRFLEHARARGVTAPITPGLLPVTDLKQIIKISKMCGAAVPPWLTNIFAGLEDNPESRQIAGGIVLAEQIRQLAAGGVSRFHIYTLNRALLPVLMGNLFGGSGLSGPNDLANQVAGRTDLPA